MSKLTKMWLKLSLENRKRIVSFANTFVVTLLMFLAVRLEMGFPGSWAAWAALLTAGIRTSIRETLNAIVAFYNEK